MICPYCSTDIEPIELNGKTFCSNCGLSINQVDQSENESPEKVQDNTLIEVVSQPISAEISTGPTQIAYEGPSQATTLESDELVPEVTPTVNIDSLENTEPILSDILQSTPQENIFPSNVTQEEERDATSLDNSTASQNGTSTEPSILMDILEKPAAEEVLSAKSSENESKTFEDSVKNIDSLGAAGILLDILGDESAVKQKESELTALEAANEVVDKVNFSTQENPKTTGASKLQPVDSIRIKVDVLEDSPVNTTLHPELPAGPEELDLPLPRDEFQAPLSTEDLSLNEPERDATASEVISAPLAEEVSQSTEINTDLDSPSEDIMATSNVLDVQPWQEEPEELPAVTVPPAADIPKEDTEIINDYFNENQTETEEEEEVDPEKIDLHDKQPGSENFELDEKDTPVLPTIDEGPTEDSAQDQENLSDIEDRLSFDNDENLIDDDAAEVKASPEVSKKVEDFFNTSAKKEELVKSLVSKKPKEKKVRPVKSKKTKKQNSKLLLNIGIFIAILVLSGGLLSYLFLFEDKKPINAVNSKSLEASNFSINKPVEIPYGYIEKDNEFDPSANILTINYFFINDDSRVLTFKQKFTEKPDEELTRFVSDQAGKFEVKLINERNLTVFENGTTVWTDDKYLYTIEVKGESYKNLIEKMALSVE